MHIGRQLLGSSGKTTSVLTDWLPRGGDSAVFTVELIEAIDATIAVTVFHKDSEATGPGASAATLVSATSTLGLHKATIGPLETMVRYRIDVAGVGATGSVLYRLHEPTWFDTARA